MSYLVVVIVASALAALVATPMWQLPTLLGLSAAGFVLLRYRTTRGGPAALKGLLRSVLRHVPELGPKDVELRILPRMEPNAHPIRTAAGERSIVVSVGMATLMDDRDALWAVLAHEVGHHVLGHLEEDPDVGAAVTRRMELEADAWAARLAVKAGRDPRAALRALERLGAIERELLAGRPRPTTHPDTEERIRALRVVVAQLEREGDARH